MSTTVIPAGWYPDPAGGTSARWWSGEQWTAHVRAPEPTPTAPTGPTLTAPTGPALTAAEAPGVPVAPPWVRQMGAPPPGITLPGDRGVGHGSPDTVGIWLLAFAPLMTFVVVVAGTSAMGLAGLPVPSPLLFWLPVLAAEWVFAGLDRAALGRRGFRRPGILWMLLLPPLVYFIVRGRRVRERGARAWPPELAYFLQIALSFALNVLLSPLLMR